MTAWLIVFVVFAVGCVGGLVNAVLTGEIELPKRDEQAGVYRPGWLGNVLIGGVSALVFWGLYGPMATVSLIGGGEGGPVAVLRVSELFGALLTGVGGGRILTSEVQKKLLVKETEELDKTKTALVSAVKQLSEE